MPNQMCLHGAGVSSQWVGFYGTLTHKISIGVKVTLSVITKDLGKIRGIFIFGLSLTSVGISGQWLNFYGIGIQEKI